MEEELFEDFSAILISSRIKKNWSVLYKGKEITGTYTYDQDDWGLHEQNCVIDDEHLKDLTEDDIDTIYDYIQDVI